MAFDIPPGAPHGGADIDNDGTVDNGYRDGVNHMALGLYDFYGLLRNEIGEDKLITGDGEEMADQRFPDVTNGAENEDFPGYMNFSRYPEQFHLHLWWCSRARNPNATYLVMRYPTDAHHYQPNTAKLRDWMHNNFARLGIATACFGNGDVAYEASRVWDGPLDNRRQSQNVLSESLVNPAVKLIIGKPYCMWDEYNAGHENRFRWLGKPTESMTYQTSHLGDGLLPSDANWTYQKSDDLAIQVTNFESAPSQQQLAVAVDFTKTPAKPWTSGAGWIGPKKLRNGTSVFVRSPVLSCPLQKGMEYAVGFTGTASMTSYKKVDPVKYKAIPLAIGFRIRMQDGTFGQAQWVYLDEKPWTVQLTVTAPKDGLAQLEILAGVEQGSFLLNALSLREGCGEVASRRFENGLVLMNGSEGEAVSFDLEKIDPQSVYRRIKGVIDPKWNNGRAERGVVTLPPRESLFLKKM